VSLRDVGWVWEGVAFDPGVEPTIYGVGEGAQYFGLKRACFMFHPNNPITLRKLQALDEVVCDIMKWEFREVHDDSGRAAFQNYLKGDPAITLREAQKVSRLSRDFPNVSGAIIDDMSGLINSHGYTPERHAEVCAALKEHNAALRLWCVVYSHELNADYWRPYLPGVDVANLWVWEAKNLVHLDEYVEKCREVFPGKPVVLGCYLRDYPTRSPVPLEAMEFQFNRIVDYLAEGKINGFSILAACLIDQHPEQAEWVRDFLARH
jgi:hypothetical protein